MKKVDAHIHYDTSLDSDLVRQMLEEENAEAAAFLCIPKGSWSPTETDAFSFQSEIPIYIFGSISRKIYCQELKASDLTDELKRIKGMGCIGVKMLEGKPVVRKHWQIPDFDLPVWEDYWTALEQSQFPVVMHVNDPETFWDYSEAGSFARKAGWIYDNTYVGYEEQYRQMNEVLVRHPNLRILFPHFYFMSGRLSQLSVILERYPNVFIDITPGIELYLNLGRPGKMHDEAVSFFIQYQDRILYGTDIGARQVIKRQPAILNISESRARVRLITDFLEKKGEYILCDDGAYFTGQGNHILVGLGLSEKILSKVYRTNFYHFINSEW